MKPSDQTNVVDAQSAGEQTAHDTARYMGNSMRIIAAASSTRPAPKRT
jgi:hypothetical protein